ncbi:hypothetical protein FSP39_024823 [Pinctada imbricata]|uniref:Uncharacterized protein n=1 Tax=Pinctada imbricata TaxID=66713 RepID=A0AA88Y6E3_PINIB|nr:hypothetical protein FSP39_024823 [Pinctada imbricata]
MYIEVKTSRDPKSPTAPYPGYDLDDTYREPTPVPRVRPEGEPYAAKNRGTIDKWAFFKLGAETYRPSQPDPRCPTRESKDNYTHGKHGTIKPLLCGKATPRPETAPPRIKSEGEPIATISRGPRMKKLIHKFAQSAPSPRVPRVKPEAEGIVVPHRGGRMNNLIHSYGKLPLSDRGVPRVKSEGEDNAELDKGKRMNKIIHESNQRKGSVTSRAVPRVKIEGEGNAELDKGKRMNRLIHSYGELPLSDRGVPRVKSEGDPNYKLDMGGRMSRLMHEMNTGRNCGTAVPRVRYPEANAILRKSRGQMGKILRQAGQKTLIHVPGYQNKRYERCPTM